jgi:hypothetical protein
MSRDRSRLSTAGLPVLLAAICVLVLATNASASVTIFSGAIDNTDTSLVQRFSQNGVASSCAATKAFTGAIAAGTRHFDRYTDTNHGLGDACVEVIVDGSACGSNMAATSMGAQPAFVAADIANGYRGDAGLSSNSGTGGLAYSFLAAPGNLDIVVYDIGASLGCTSYTLSRRVSPNGATAAATNVTPNTATLNGTVNRESEPNATYHFEYGTTTAYGTATPTTAVASATGNLPVAADVTALEPATTYHYRVVVSRVTIGAFAAAASPGADQTFTTSATPPVGAPPVAAPPVAAPTSPPPAVFADVTAPSFRRTPYLVPTTFRAAARGSSVRAARVAVGTRLRYSLSEAARVTFTVHRRVRGRRLGRRCVVGRRVGRRCVKLIAVTGSFSVNSAAGATSRRITGRLSGRRLAPGSYRLTGRARDAAGNRSRAAYANFTIVP